VRTFQQGDNAMVIEPQSVGAQRLPERHAVRRRGQAVREDRTARQGSRRLQGDKLSLNFQNVDVRALLQVIADFTTEHRRARLGRRQLTLR
jgi:type IV pilus assembly protein PilQ